MMTHGSLFSGIGGFELGAANCGIETLWSCELEYFQRKVLEKNFPKTKIYNDVKKLETSKLERVDIVSGGFPCQDISVAGGGAGIAGSRSGLWGEMFRVCRDLRPAYILIENSSMLAIRGLERVLCDLSSIGYDAEWQSLSGYKFGLQHKRARLYIIAYPSEINTQGGNQEAVFRQPFLHGEPPRVSPGWRERGDIPQPRNYRSSNELPNLLDRIGSLGNAVCPIIATYLFKLIKAHHAGL